MSIRYERLFRKLWRPRALVRRLERPVYPFCLTRDKKALISS
jgi:hypothetical protein